MLLPPGFQRIRLNDPKVGIYRHQQMIMNDYFLLFSISVEPTSPAGLNSPITKIEPSVILSI